MAYETPITIKKAIENIRKKHYVLPSIQREFVWEHTKIEWLFDSLMRNYPISSFLLWQVESEVKKGYKFYKFISKYREKFKTHNSEISVDGINEFKAVLDGQQRLTSIYIGLKGSYAYKDYKKKWENTEWSIPTRQLYLNITNELKDEEDGRVYEFKFLKKDDTKEKIIFQDPKEQKWFRIGEILNYQNEEKFDEFIEKLDSLFAKKALRQLRRTILEKEVINYFLEKEQDLDKALNIFIRINSGGEPLNFSDLIMSIAVANWENNDARQVIHSLVDNIRDKGFLISKDFILKVFLYLYSKDIKFKVTNFSKEKIFDNTVCFLLAKDMNYQFVENKEKKQIEENKKKMKQLHAVLLITGIPLNIIQWVSIILWITTGIQWLFWGYILVAIPYAIFIIRFLSKRIVYICPQCHEIFKPHLKEFIFSNHSMTLRKLTCTSCGYHGFCVETYREEEKNNE